MKFVSSLRSGLTYCCCCVALVIPSKSIVSPCASCCCCCCLCCCRCCFEASGVLFETLCFVSSLERLPRVVPKVSFISPRFRAQNTLNDRLSAVALPSSWNHCPTHNVIIKQRTGFALIENELLGCKLWFAGFTGGQGRHPREQSWNPSRRQWERGFWIRSRFDCAVVSSPRAPPIRASPLPTRITLFRGRYR